MTDEFAESDDHAKKVAQKTAEDILQAISILVTGGEDTRKAFIECVSESLEVVYQRNGRLAVALNRLLAAPNDHMTACDRTMGDSHPCTCGANSARQLLQ